MKRIGASTRPFSPACRLPSSSLLLLLLLSLLMMVQQTTSFLLPSLPSSSHPVAKPQHHPHHYHHHHQQQQLLLTREKEAAAVSNLLARSPKPLYSTTSSSNNAGNSGGVTPSPSSSSQPAEPQIEFSDDWKTMVEEGIPIDLSAIYPDAETLSTKDGTVFLSAFNNKNKDAANKSKSPNFLQRLLGLGKKNKKVNPHQQQKGTDSNVREISARDWWRWTPEEQREFLEATTNTIAPPSSPATEASPAPSSSSPSLTTKPNSNNNQAGAPAVQPPPTIFLLRHGFPFSSLTSRVAYHPTTGRFALAETPLFEKTRLYTWWFPLIVRVLLPVARPLYAPLFCLKWLGLKFMIVWRSFSQFVWPSPPYVVLFSIRALYMLGACMLVTVALDELMQPVLEWIYKVVMKAAGKTGSGTVLPDLRFYSLDGRGKQGPSNWDERLWNL